MEIIGLDKAIETIIFEGTLEDMEDKIVEENIEMIGIMTINRSRNRTRERTFTRSYDNNRDRSSSNSRSKSGSRANTNRDRIRCYNCREYDHFARDYPSSREERDLRTITTNTKYGSRRTEKNKLDSVGIVVQLSDNI